MPGTWTTSQGLFRRGRLAPGRERSGGDRGLLAGAGDRRDRLRLQVDGADGVVLGVGDVEGLADQAHPLRAVERGLVEVAVDQARRSPVPIDVGCLPSRSVIDDPVVAGVGDEQPLARRVGEDLAGEEQRAVVRASRSRRTNLTASR